MTVAIGEFWKLATASRLLSAEDCRHLEAGFAQVKGAASQGNASTLGEWLVNNGTLSRFQVQTLLAGRPGPFLYGEYCVYDRIRSKEGRLAGSFRAVHTATRHPVLLYFFPKEIAESAEWWPAAVQQTAWACWAGHPFVSDCYQVLELGRVKLAAIEHLGGDTMAAWLAASGRMAAPDACRLVRQAALGLARLHQLGQIHNEIRPENLWVGPDGVAKLLQVPLAPEPLRGPGPIDWNQPDPNGQLLRRADYAAPEMNQPGRPPDAASDMYALGCTLFELLAGQPPFAGGDLTSKRTRQAMEAPPALEPFGVPQPLEQMIGYLLAKDPAQRYQQAAQVADALAYFVDPAALQMMPAAPPTLAAFDAWLQQQQRVPGAEPGTIPTAGQMAAMAAGQIAAHAPDAAAQYQPAQDQAAQNGWGQSPAGDDPSQYAQAAAQPYSEQSYAQQPVAEQPFVDQAPVAPDAGAFDFAAQYREETMSKLDEFVVPNQPSYGAQPGFDVASPQAAAGNYFEPPAMPDPLAFVAASPAPPAYTDFASAGFDAGANVATHGPSAPAALTPALSQREREKAGVDLGGVVEPLKPSARARKPAAKGLDPKIMVIGGGGLLAVLLCVGLFIATRGHANDNEVAIVTPPNTPVQPTPPRVTPAVDKTKGGGDKGGTTSGPPKIIIDGGNALHHGDDSGGKTDDGGKTKITDTPPKGNGETINADDGSALWASPTSGAPLELNYVAGGAQAILAIRPAAIVRRDNGDQFLPALGPWGDVAVKLLKTLSGLDPPQIKQVIVIWHDNGSGQLTPTITIRGDDKMAAETLLAGWGNPAPTKEGDETYYQGPAWSYYFPSKEAGQVLVVGQAAQIKDIIQAAASGGSALSRYLERILQGTDGDRDVTFVLTPEVMFTDHQWFFAGELGALRQPMEKFFGSETRAAAISAHFQGDLFLELRVLGSSDDAQTFANQFAARVRGLPELVENSLNALNLHKYDLKLLHRFPEQLRTLAANVRSDTDDDEALLRCYLPGVATHNLLMAGELAMAEQPLAGGGGPTVEKVATVAELLHKKTSLVFPRDTLEKSLQMLFGDIGVTHEIMGPDLQLEGITKNQSFGMDEHDKPAVDILLKILKQANPDGKLVYVIKPKQPGGPEMVFITTRASAAKRGDKLPPELQTGPDPKGPKKKP